MGHGQLARQGVERRLGKDVLHLAQGLVVPEAVPALHGHAAALLAPVLKGIQGQGAGFGGLWQAVHAKDAAFFVKVGQGRSSP